MLQSRFRCPTSARLPACKQCMLATKPTKRNRTQLRAAAAPVATGTNVWAKFAESITGEWEGATASFNPTDGTPIPLDPYFVPQAFRDWGVELYDWQTTCSTLAKAEELGSIKNICRCMMPTVGCEADAVAFTEEAQATVEPLYTVAPDGCYVAGPLQLDADDGRARIEFCVPLASVSQQEQEDAQQRRERVRVVHRLQVNWQSKLWELSRVDVHKERYDGPYSGQMDLCGCGGGMPGFSKQEAVSEERAKGAETWQLTNTWAYDVDAQGNVQLSQPPPSSPLASDSQGFTRTLLPLGVVLHSRVAGDKGDLDLQLAVSVGNSENHVATCSYVGGRLSKVAMGSQLA